MGNKLYVGNLAFPVTNEALESVFAEYGTVESAKVISDRDSGRSKGFGFVEMSSDGEADKCIEHLDGTELEGRLMKVNKAKPQEKGNRGRRF